MGVWQMGPPNWGSLNLRIGGMSVEDALAQPQKSLNNWRTHVKDLWNVAGICSGTTGLSTITSHYGYWMSSWHLVFSLAGQDADLSVGKLQFAPAVSVPFSLPVVLAGTIGSISSPDGKRFTLTVTAGSPITLTTLGVGKVMHPAGQITLAPGQSTEWG